jgi:hypothetical protein
MISKNPKNLYSPLERYNILAFYNLTVLVKYYDLKSILVKYKILFGSRFE